jgi:protein gp37
MDPKWVLNIRDQCRKTKVPFFFKQWGGKNRKKTGRVLEGRTWDQMPLKSTQLNKYAVG